MPSTHFIEETPHRLVRIDQYFRWLDSTIHERLKGLQATPQHIALDGWLAAVKAAQLVAGSTWTSADKRRIREDRVREILLSKEIEPEELVCFPDLLLLFLFTALIGWSWYRILN